VGDHFAELAAKVLAHIPTNSNHSFMPSSTRAKRFPCGPASLNKQVILVLKASIDDTTSSNGISRIEFEAVMTDLSLAQLDQLLLDAGFTYQAKWSRERKAYQLGKKSRRQSGHGFVLIKMLATATWLSLKPLSPTALRQKKVNNNCANSWPNWVPLN